MDIKYPHIKVKLTGADGNAFNILGLVFKALKEHDVPATERNTFYSEATSGNYDFLLRTVTRWVTVR